MDFLDASVAAEIGDEDAGSRPWGVGVDGLAEWKQSAPFCQRSAREGGIAGSLQQEA